MARLSKSANPRHESTFCNTSTVSHLTRPGTTASRELSMAKFKLPSYPETISFEISSLPDGNKTFWTLRSYELPNNKVPSSGSARVHWRALSTEHQKLFPTSAHRDDDAASIEVPGILLDTQPDPASLVEGAMDTASIVVFGQRPGSLAKRRRTKPVVPEQASLFSLS